MGDNRRVRLEMPDIAVRTIKRCPEEEHAVDRDASCNRAEAEDPTLAGGQERMRTCGNECEHWRA